MQNTFIKYSVSSFVPSPVPVRTFVSAPVPGLVLSSVPVRTYVLTAIEKLFNPAHDFSRGKTYTNHQSLFNSAHDFSRGYICTINPKPFQRFTQNNKT